MSIKIMKNTLQKWSNKTINIHCWLFNPVSGDAVAALTELLAKALAKDVLRII